MERATRAPVTEEESTFELVLRELEHGETAMKLGSQLVDLVRQVLETGQKGKLALEIQVRPAGEGIVEFLPAVKTTAPCGSSEPSKFYFRNGSLSRRDPRQPVLPSLAPEVSRAASRMRRTLDDAGATMRIESVNRATGEIGDEGE